MNIQAVNAVSKTFVQKVNKQVTQQPKMVAGLVNDTFQRRCEVTNPIKTYNAPIPSFTGAFGTWTYRKLPYPDAQRNHIAYFIKQANHYDGKWGGLSEVIAETNALRDSYTTEMSLAPRVQYLQQHYPRTIAYINGRLENYKG